MILIFFFIFALNIHYVHNFMNNYIVLIGLAAFIFVLLCGIVYVFASGSKKSVKKEKNIGAVIKKSDMTDREVLMTKHVTVTVTRKVTPLNELAESEIGKNLEMDESVNDQLITVDIDFDDYDSEYIGIDNEDSGGTDIEDPAILKSIFESLAKSNERELEKRSVPEGFTMPPSNLDALQQSVEGLEKNDVDYSSGVVESEVENTFENISSSDTDIVSVENSSDDNNYDEFNENSNYYDELDADMKGFVISDEKPEEPDI